MTPSSSTARTIVEDGTIVVHDTIVEHDTSHF